MVTLTILSRIILETFFIHQYSRINKQKRSLDNVESCSILCSSHIFQNFRLNDLHFEKSAIFGNITKKFPYHLALRKFWNILPDVRHHSLYPGIQRTELIDRSGMVFCVDIVENDSTEAQRDELLPRWKSSQYHVKTLHTEVRRLCHSSGGRDFRGWGCGLCGYPPSLPIARPLPPIPFLVKQKLKMTVIPNKVLHPNIPSGILPQFRNPDGFYRSQFLKSSLNRKKNLRDLGPYCFKTDRYKH